MNPGNSFTTFAMAAGLLAGLLVLGAHTVRRISARAPSGRHWLLRSLALLSPVCLLAGLAIGMFGPHFTGRAEPAHLPGLWETSMVLILVGALTLPVLWRTLLQQRFGRPVNALPFFHASRTSLLVLFVLAVIYMKVARTAAAELMPWLTSPGLWPAVARIAGQSMQVAMLAVVLTLSLMVVRRAMTGFLRLLSGLFRRSPGL
ncbi:hypothetical protein U0039_08525 [Stenotrophomonas maltophilia]|uniref:hypothetical protein n=1 Tax=Stenotrophomonas maltophilia TaxID=40324 RepID=UPI00046A7DD1|nr:hypothetical protein [Stenotrophomonas maltophilia]OMP39913.1 hypothetical protein BMR86_09975 [Stenotrophomonas sp. KAs 5-3]AIL10333.1 putative membrane protein [Stenotrophomonas maltophilia]OOD19452.1 hypothetical protein BWP19_02045 [Stenotrophomonas maltophilia]QQA84171.1 hypothetical protein I6I01_07135 [Stenotrophomonas maltophilia]WQE25385.1 hypothetical protein U0039_08525 [Stenotrophomonas maltophilia]